jgi:hypothetical protein
VKRGADLVGVAIGVPLVLLLVLVVPLTVLIGLPGQILRDSVGLSPVTSGLIAVPLGVTAVAFVYWALATGRANWDGDD